VRFRNLFGAIAIFGAAAFFAAPPANAGGENAQLIGGVWQWKHTLLNDDSRFTPLNSASYTLEFRDDGSVHAKVDCNRMSGNFERNGAKLKIDLLLGTRAMCPPDSLDGEFERQIGEVRQKVLDGDMLHLDLEGHRGTMSFAR